MKEKTHPKYETVCFEDITAGKKFLSRSTLKSEDKITIDGTEYPLVQVEVTSASHPFYTGEKIFIDTAGRVENFNKRYSTIVGAKRKTRKQKPVKVKKKK